MKISYVRLAGYESTAYVDEPDAEPLVALVGVDKYSDETVTIQWDEQNQLWVEMERPHNK